VLEALRILLKGEGYQTEAVTSLTGIISALEKRLRAADNGSELCAGYYVGTGRSGCHSQDSGDRQHITDRRNRAEAGHHRGCLVRLTNDDFLDAFWLSFVSSRLSHFF